eukprot:1159005-Pelagomonas_calceolata.AAC.1
MASSCCKPKRLQIAQAPEQGASSAACQTTAGQLGGSDAKKSRQQLTHKQAWEQVMMMLAPPQLCAHVHLGAHCQFIPV